MLSLDSYYNVARQNWGGKIVKEGDRLTAVDKSANYRRVSIRPDPAREQFCVLLAEKYRAGEGQGSGGLAEQVINDLQSRKYNPLGAEEVNSARHALKYGIGSQTIEWLTEKETVTNVDGLKSAEDELLNMVGEQNRFSARKKYRNLWKSLEQEGGILSKNRPVSDLTEEEMDLAVRTLSGFILAHEEHESDFGENKVTREKWRKATDNLKVLLRECRHRKLVLSKRSGMQTAMALDILHGQGALSSNVRYGDYTKYRGTLEKVGELKSQPGADRKYMLRLKGKEGVKTIEIVSYNGFKGQLKRFWDWVSRNGLRENRAVMRELKNTCRDSGIFRSTDFDNEIWQPALKEAGVSHKTSLAPVIIENLLKKAIGQAMATNRVNSAFAYNDLLPIYPEDEGGDGEQLRRSLLKLLPNDDQWTSAVRQETLQEHINTETLYSIRNQAVAGVVSRIDPFLSHANEILEVSNEEVRKVFLDKLEQQCQAYENLGAHPGSEAEIRPAEIPASDGSKLSSSS